VLTSAFAIAVEYPDRSDIRALIADLNAHLLSLYTVDECHHLSIEELSRPEVTFLVARDQGRAVGCGALRRLTADLGEVKRMYTVPRAQGLGVGRAILHAIEAEARRQGLRGLVLETGDRQPAALHLYATEGFARRGPYLDYPENGVSVFMEKRISA
jgi:putative acetyltransferase